MTIQRLIILLAVPVLMTRLAISMGAAVAAPDLWILFRWMDIRLASIPSGQANSLLLLSQTKEAWAVITGDVPYRHGDTWKTT